MGKVLANTNQKMIKHRFLTDHHVELFIITNDLFLDIPPSGITPITLIRLLNRIQSVREFRIIEVLRFHNFMVLSRNT